MRERIAIFGQYKTGTTGLFLKIRNSHPGTPRTLFEESRYDPEPADSRNGVLAKVIIERSLECPGDLESFFGFEKRILLVRDPRDWLVSKILFHIQQDPSIWRNRMLLARILRLLRAKERAPNEVSFRSIFETVASAANNRKTTADSVLSWIGRQFACLVSVEEQLKGNCCKLRYEDYVAGSLDPLSSYLGFALDGDELTQNEFPHVMRTRAAGDWERWFLPEDVDYFGPVLNPWIRKLGYVEAPIPKPPASLNPAFSSRFVLRGVRLRRSPAHPTRILGGE